MSTKDFDNREAIWTAAINGDWGTVKQLLEREQSLIDVIGTFEIIARVITHFEATLLHVAVVKCPNTEILKYLVSQGANVNAKAMLFTPLHLAAQWNTNVDVVKYLVSKGANINATNVDENTPLHFAARYNSNAEILKYLVSKDADVNSINLFGLTPFDYAKGRENRRFLRECMQNK